MVSKWEDSAVLNNLNEDMDRICTGKLFQSVGALNMNDFLPTAFGILVGILK